MSSSSPSLTFLRSLHPQIPLSPINQRLLPGYPAERTPYNRGEDTTYCRKATRRTSYYTGLNLQGLSSHRAYKPHPRGERPRTRRPCTHNISPLLCPIPGGPLWACLAAPHARKSPKRQSQIFRNHIRRSYPKFGSHRPRPELGTVPAGILLII